MQISLSLFPLSLSPVVSPRISLDLASSLVPSSRRPAIRSSASFDLCNPRYVIDLIIPSGSSLFTRVPVSNLHSIFNTYTCMPSTPDLQHSPWASLACGLIAMVPRSECPLGVSQTLVQLVPWSRCRPAGSWSPPILLRYASWSVRPSQRSI